MSIDKGISLNNLAIDIWKFIFAVIIVINHSNNFYFIDIAPRGSIGVEFFFIVSGFLMSKSIFEKRNRTTGILGSDTAKFLLRKYKGIATNFIIAIVCSYIYTGIANVWAFEKYIKTLPYVLPELLCLQMFGFNNCFWATGTAWYLSAMFISMAIIFPLIVKYKKNISYIVAPLTVMFIYGFFWKKSNGVASPVSEIGVVYKGILRGVAGILLGSISYEIKVWLERLEFTNFGRILITVIELVSMIGAIILMFTLKKANRNDFWIIVLLFIGITLCFSNKSIITSKINGKKNQLFRKASISVFFNNQYVARNMNKIYVTCDAGIQLIIYFVLVLIFSGLNYFLTDFIKNSTIYDKCIHTLIKREIK